MNAATIFTTTKKMEIVMAVGKLAAPVKMAVVDNSNSNTYRHTVITTVIAIILKISIVASPIVIVREIRVINMTGNMLMLLQAVFRKTPVINV